MRWSRNGGKTLSSSRRYRSRQSGGVPRLKEFRKLCMNIVNVGAGGNILKGSYNGGEEEPATADLKNPSATCKPYDKFVRFFIIFDIGRLKLLGVRK